jgi:hypothetical protein
LQDGEDNDSPLLVLLQLKSLKTNNMINLQQSSAATTTELVSAAKECVACGVNYFYALSHQEQDLCSSCNADLISITKDDLIFKIDENDN